MDDIEAEAYRLLVEPTPRDSRPASKMKPNTRFLRHIVRNANNHNAALLAKETADSQRRLKDLMRKDGGSGDQDDDDDSSSRSHDKHDRDSGRKRSENSKDDRPRHSRRSERDRDDRESRSDKSSRSHRHRSNREGHDDQDKDDQGRCHRAHRSHRDTHSRSRERHERHRSAKHRRRSKSPEAAHEGRLSPPPERSYRDRSPHKKHHRRHHDKNESTSRRNSDRDQRKMDEKDRKSAHSSRKGRSSKRDKSSSRSRSRSRSESEGYSTSDSDPLDEFVGPRLASDSLRQEKDRVRMKGRGAFSSAALGGPGSSIDRHFASGYDPSHDVEMQDEAETKQTPRPSVQPRPSSAAEDAQTEMQRDRKQLLRDGAERLRAAGFTDREIAIWARGGRREVAPRDAAPKANEAQTKDAQDESSAPWAKKGEAREWDRGKEVDDDGPAKPIWAR